MRTAGYCKVLKKRIGMPAVTALWLSFLFLPFKGIKASFFLFISILVVIPSAGFVFRYLSSFASVIDKQTKNYRQRFTSDKRFPYLAIVPLLLLPFIAEDYIIDIAIMSGIYIMLALGLNVVIGFAGLLNLGFVAFYAIGAYSYALLSTKLGIGFWGAMPLAAAITTLSGFLLAVPALRLKGDYLAIVTLGFGEIVRLVLNNWDSFTKGPNGISGIKPPFLLGADMGPLPLFYCLVLVFVIISAVIIGRVRSSGIGRAWIAIREDDIASSAMGISTTLYKLYSFAFGAFWAGLAGSLFAAKMRFVSPESFTFMESVLILCMVILGGLGSIAGVILGALILVFLPEVLREVQMYRMLALGAGLVMLMIFRPQGLFGGRSAASGS